ncbi:ATP-binding protein [Candidatus Bathyarchaeota archaeon]|nr:MAG: ATP-binding protein [Candidatus Bathyarchaeota archaeon]
MVVVGGNNAGKTSVLEALFLAPNPLRTTAYNLEAVRVLQKLHETLQVKGYLFLMNQYNAKEAEIEIKVEDKINKIKIYNDVDKLFFYSLTNSDASPYGCTGKFSDVISSEFLMPDELREKYIWSSKHPSFFEALLYHPNLRKLAWEAFRNRWAEIIPVTFKVASEFSGISWEQITNITLEPFGGSPENLSLYVMLKDGGRVRLGDLGDGVQSLITLLLLYEISKPKILLVDDLESHMNPRALNLLFEWLLERIEEGIYIVASTHNLEVGKKFLSYFEEWGAEGILLGLKEGILKHKKLSLDKIEGLEQEGIDVRVAEPYLL